MKITVNDNGSIKVEGEFTVLDGQGNALETKDAAWLCRCGGSANKPFCDGTHKSNGFQSQVRA
jgi:CDGSH-type Zn-finger protein